MTGPSLPPPSGRWDVQLTVRCQPRLARVVRTTAASCAAVDGFTLDDIDDVRLLADEAFSTMCETGASSARLRLAVHASCLRFELRGTGGGRRGLVDDRLVTTLAAGIARDSVVALHAPSPWIAATIDGHG